MGRNPEINARVKAMRREQILEDSFRIFAEKGIDSLSMNEVADACGVGIATVYRYFSTKSALVLAVNSWAWEDFLRRSSVYRTSERATAAEAFDYYLESFLELYQNHRDLLRFNQFFNIYVRREEIPPERLAPYMALIKRLEDRFRAAYEKGRRDGTLRTDLPEKEMFAASLHLMLAAATRFAVGVVYSDGGGPEQELLLLKRLLMREYTTGKRAAE